MAAHAKHMRNYDQETEEADFSVWINLQTSGILNNFLSYHLPDWNKPISSSHSRNETKGKKKKKKHEKYKNNGMKPERIFFFHKIFPKYKNVYHVNKNLLDKVYS